MLRCLTLTAEKDEKKIEDIYTYRRWIDAVEIRLDLCERANEHFIGKVLNAAARAAAEVILTYRRKQDGGPRVLDESQRLQKLAALLRPGVAYVDIEHGVKAEQVQRRAAETGAKVIRSLHDFDGIPSVMSALIASIAAAGEIPKIACFPKSSADVHKLMFACTETASIREKIIIGMGGYGFFTRAAPLLCGSMLTFCSSGSLKGAPGQIGPAELEQVYRVSSQNDDTVYYGIIGNPVLHSSSPRIHNKWFADAGMNAAYLPFQVDEVGLFMKLAGRIGIRGFSVTVPHKQNIIEFLDEIDEAVHIIGSCNTVVRCRRGWRGSNTDYEGFLEPLKRRNLLNPGDRALVVGAGGVARTVVYALQQARIDVTVVNRTESRASALAAEFGVHWRSVESNWNKVAGYQLVIQTSSAGMEPDTDTDPLPAYRFNGSEIVYELIYSPEQTRFLRRASEAGCLTLGGSEMLQAQAVLQFEQFSKVYHSQGE
ncbi:MAG: shikimate dehydrogenase [Spirochaetia bacterium]